NLTWMVRAWEGEFSKKSCFGSCFRNTRAGIGAQTDADCRNQEAEAKLDRMRRVFRIRTRREPWTDADRKSERLMPRCGVIPSRECKARGGTGGARVGAPSATAARRDAPDASATGARQGTRTDWRPAGRFVQLEQRFAARILGSPLRPGSGSRS